MSEYLPCVEIGPENANAAVIWLHGLGADGHDFEPVVPQLGLPPDLPVRFLMPHAPAIPITVNQGYVMPAWFDLLELGKEDRINMHQLLASAAAVHALIDRELERGVKSERVILVGFSQGGAVNYQAALTYDKPLAGLLALSTWFPTAEALELHPANHGLPVKVCHGISDSVLPESMALNAVRKLRRLGFHPDYHRYAMDHSLCPEEIADISDWIQEFLG